MIELEEYIKHSKKQEPVIKNNKTFKIDKLSIEYESKTYFLTNNKKESIGNINVDEIIKYSIITIDPENTLLSNIKLSDNKIKLIEHYICNTYRENNSVYIEFNNIEKSEFGSDPELLIQLNKDLCSFEEEHILNNNKIAQQIKNIIRQMIYNLLDNILKLLYSLSYKIKESKKEIPYLLMKYSNAVVYKINKRIQYDLEKKHENITYIYENIKKLNEYNKSLNEKIEILNDNIAKQSDIITKLINNSTENKNSDDIYQSKSQPVLLSKSNNLPDHSNIQHSNSPNQSNIQYSNSPNQSNIQHSNSPHQSNIQHSNSPNQ